jgi:hypothetical protein
MRSPISTQLNESLDAVKARVADKNYALTTSFRPRCAVAVLRWNEADHWILELRDRLESSLSPGTFERNLKSGRKVEKPSACRGEQTLRDPAADGPETLQGHPGGGGQGDSRPPGRSRHVRHSRRRVAPSTIGQRFADRRPRWACMTAAALHLRRRGKRS